MKKLVAKILSIFGLKVSLIQSSLIKPSARENKIVRNTIGEKQFLMNATHIHNSKFLFESYSKNLIRISKTTINKYQDASIIDVGANIGDSVGLIRTEITSPIICIEGDSFYYDLLKKNLESFENVISIQHYLGESDNTISASPIHEHGTLKLSNDVIDNQKIQIKTLDTLIKETQIDWGNIKLLKVDTDGFDNAIIKGSKNLLKSNKPVIFFEYSEMHLRENGSNGLDIFPFLVSYDYENIMFYEPNGRFILSTETKNQNLIEQIHDFISNFSNPIQYLDIAAFHKDDMDIFNAILIEEKEINVNTSNKMILNKK